jgi:hypothetical protein
MELASGFQLERPHLLVPWGLSEERLRDLFKGLELRRVTDGYFVTRCTSLGGLSHDLGFHFTPRISGTLTEFELFQSSYASNDTSYREFQIHLETAFGIPTVTSPGTEGFPSHLWRIKDVQVINSVQEHFGPAEYLRITRIKPGS